MKNNETLVLTAALIMATTTAFSMIAALPVAFADESETETELEAEQENSCSGFNYLCQGTAQAVIQIGKGPCVADCLLATNIAAR